MKLELEIVKTFFFFYLGFLSGKFTIHRTGEEGKCYLFNSSLPLPPGSQTLTHQLSGYCRDIISAHSQQLSVNQTFVATDMAMNQMRIRVALKICLLNSIIQLLNSSTFLPSFSVSSILIMYTVYLPSFFYLNSSAYFT